MFVTYDKIIYRYTSIEGLIVIMSRNNSKKIKYAIISAIALLSFTTTIAYAVFSQQLIISGNVSKKGGSWNIYFSNASVYNTTGSAVSEEVEVSATDSTSLNISASLTQPGDSITYTFRVNNGGTIDAKLSSWGFENTSEFNAFINQYSISYSLTYFDGTELTPSQDILRANDYITLKFTLKYNGTEAITDDDVSVPIKIKLIYAQNTAVTS